MYSQFSLVRFSSVALTIVTASYQHKFSIVMVLGTRHFDESSRLPAGHVIAHRLLFEEILYVPTTSSKPFCCARNIVIYSSAREGGGRWRGSMFEVGASTADDFLNPR